MIRIGELFKKEVLEMWNEYCDSEKQDSVLKMVFGEAFSKDNRQKGSLLGGCQEPSSQEVSSRREKKP